MMNLFVFGAGASYGSGPCLPEPPPLANILFDKLCQFGGIANELDPQCGDVFRVNFEVGMELLFRRDAAATHHLLRDMSRYFAQFEPYEENIYHHLIRFLAQSRQPFLFSTTNYDMVIEHAVAHLRIPLNYLTGGPQNNVCLLKIHGSCNFLPELNGINIQGASIRGVVEVAPNIVLSASEIVQFCMAEDSISPAIAMFARGKPMRTCEGFVKRIQEEWQQEVAKAKRIFVIGLKINQLDSHIWDHIAAARGDLYYASYGEQEQFQEWRHEIGKTNAAWLADDFTAAVPMIESVIAMGC